MRFRFEIVRATTPGDVLHRDLPDDAAAVDWMEQEVLLPGDTMRAYRGGESEPFARRASGETVEVLR